MKDFQPIVDPLFLQNVSPEIIAVCAVTAAVLVIACVFAFFEIRRGRGDR